MRKNGPIAAGGLATEHLSGPPQNRRADENEERARSEREAVAAEKSLRRREEERRWRPGGVLGEEVDAR